MLTKSAASTSPSGGCLSDLPVSDLSSFAAAMVMADDGGVVDDGVGDDVLEDVTDDEILELLNGTLTVAEKFELLTISILGLVVVGTSSFERAEGSSTMALGRKLKAYESMALSIPSGKSTVHVNEPSFEMSIFSEQKQHMSARFPL